MKRPRKPSLPLHRGVDGRLYQRTYHTPTDQQIAWLNRAAKDWPLLRRALREAIDEIEASMGGRRAPTEDQIALLGRLCEALGPAEVRRFEKIWKPR